MARNTVVYTTEYATVALGKGYGSIVTWNSGRKKLTLIRQMIATR